MSDYSQIRDVLLHDQSKGCAMSRAGGEAIADLMGEIERLKAEVAKMGAENERLGEDPTLFIRLPIWKKTALDSDD